MANFYYYLISSLPMLHFGNKPPFSFEKFLQACKGLAPEEDFAVVSSLPQAGGPAFRRGAGSDMVKKWLNFDTCLRNELVKLRASRRHLEPEKYLRPDGYAGPSITHIALAAERSLSLLEAERVFDQERWKALDELQAGHFFDAEYIFIYAYKLAILERWEKINSADKIALFEEIHVQNT